MVVPPEIIERDSPTDVLVPEGGSVKLVCRARGYPQPTVKWHRTDGGDIVLRSPNGQRTRCTNIGFLSFTTFPIYPLNPKWKRCLFYNYGTLTCHVYTI